MQGYEISMHAERYDRNVVPHLGVAFEAILQAFGEMQLASCVEAGGVERVMGWGRKRLREAVSFFFNIHRLQK